MLMGRRALCVHLSSIYLRVHNGVFVTVFRAEDDDRTRKVCDFFQIVFGPSAFASFELPIERLFRRAIGRNMAALTCNAEYIWFADCDYFFGPTGEEGVNSLDLMEREFIRGQLCYPQEIQVVQTAEAGEGLLAEKLSNGPTIVDLTNHTDVPGLFVPDPKDRIEELKALGYL